MGSSSLAEAFSPTPGFSCEQGRDAVPRAQTWERGGSRGPTLTPLGAPVLVKHLYNLTRYQAVLSLSLSFFNFIIIILATCTFLTKFIVAIKVFYFLIHITLVSSPWGLRQLRPKF